MGRAEIQNSVKWVVSVPGIGRETASERAMQAAASLTDRAPRRYLHAAQKPGAWLAWEASLLSSATSSSAPGLQAAGAWQLGLRSSRLHVWTDSTDRLMNR